MPRYKALLIGVAQYEAAGIPGLPFVHDDLDAMAAALRTRGFHQVQVAQAPYFTPNVINGAVSHFLTAADQNDRLLIMLSGHGVHDDGRDYLVPQDFDPAMLAAREGCVEIGWGRGLKNTKAAQVVFLIDACREGVSDDTMGTKPWSTGRVATAVRRKVAYVYACGQAQSAYYVRETDRVREGHDVGTEPGETFSLFSRTVTELLAGPVSTLAEFESAAQERVAALHTAYRKPGSPQRVRIRTEENPDDFEVFPPAEAVAHVQGAERTWTETVTSHHAWTLTDPGLAASVAALKECCGRLTARYARACAAVEPKLAHDPWYDDELAQRTTDRVGFLLQRLTEDTELSPTEAALLAVLPFAAQAHWAQQAARGDLPEPELDEFLSSFPRLGRRLRTLAQSPSQALSDIRSWGVHRWLVQHPEAFTHTFLTCDRLDAPAPAWALAELSAPRLLAYLKEQRVAPAAVPGSVRSTALQDERQVAPSTPYEHTVRERLVSALLKAAHALAIDPADLPEVLVEHLGISDSVSLTDLRSTLRQSNWVSAGAGRSLNALCGHPAIELALKRHAETVDTLLRDINKEAAKRGSSLSPLTSLPAYADGQQVRPSGAAPAELSSGIRFRLADDRVQELLMGEQLYGDRALAIRELYQNALDAVRYRTARTEYLRRTGTRVADWQGEIAFSEGVDPDGRPYLECADNGIGMGVTELSRAFAQGGSRFVDLPEYREEGALWSSLDPPVELVPVSRFGLGVLSYFMIADELVVWTCRLDREGRPGHELKVTIAGPGNLFRVEDLGVGREAGTRVRLYGVPGATIPSAGEELQRCLWVSPYVVRATSGEREVRWEPGVLAGVASVGAKRIRNSFRPDSGRESTPYIWSHETDGTWSSRSPRRPASAVATRHKGLWWTDGGGAVLVDGIMNDTGLFGRVADLHGADATLSVDRKKLSRYAEAVVRARSWAAVEELIDVPGLVSPAWLDAMMREDAPLAEEVTARAVERGLHWESYDWRLDAGRTGFFPPDLLLLPAVTGDRPWPKGSYDDAAALLVLCIPETVLRWRLRALHPELAMGSLPPARPSDLPLLTARDHNGWTQNVGRTTQAYAERGKDSARSRYGSFSVNTNLVAWRPDQPSVQLREVLTTAVRQWAAPARIASRLRDIGYAVAELGALEDASADDLPLLAPLRDIRETRSSRTREASPAEFILPGDCVGLAHLYAQEHPRHAARRLQSLGYIVPSFLLDRLVDDEAKDRDQATRVLARRLLRHSFGQQITPEDADRVTKGQVLFAAAFTGASTASVAGTLKGLGFVVPDPSDLPELTDEHRAAAGLARPGLYQDGDYHRVRAFSPAGGDVLEVRARLEDVSKDFEFPTPDPWIRTPAETDWTNVSTLARTVPAYRRAASMLSGSDHPHRPSCDQALMDAYRFRKSHFPTRTDIAYRDATLAEITYAALRLDRPFREVAAKATELGFRHEAENWWDDKSS